MKANDSNCQLPTDIPCRYSKRKIVLGVFLWFSLVLIIFLTPFLPQQSDRSVTTSFLPTNGSNKAILLFGFSGCNTICSTQLSLIKQVLGSKDHPEYRPHVIFIDIDQFSNTEQANRYVSGFDSRFTAHYFPLKELKKLKDLFGLTFQQQGNHITHSGRVFLLSRNNGWKIISTYNAKAFTAKALKSFLDA